MPYYTNRTHKVENTLEKFEKAMIERDLELLKDDDFIDQVIEKAEKEVVKHMCKCDNIGECQNSCEEFFLELKEEEEIEGLEIETQFLNLHKIYSLLETGNKQIDDLISKLEKLEIIGEDPTKYWEKDKTFCKLEILNPGLKISTAKIEASNNEIEDFNMHIEI